MSKQSDNRTAVQPAGSATAKNYLLAAQNLERMAAEETDPELRLLWLKASAIGRARVKSPNDQAQRRPDNAAPSAKKSNEYE